MNTATTPAQGPAGAIVPLLDEIASLRAQLAQERAKVAGLVKALEALLVAMRDAGKTGTEGNLLKAEENAAWVTDKLTGSRNHWLAGIPTRSGDYELHADGVYRPTAKAQGTP